MADSFPQDRWNNPGQPQAPGQQDANPPPAPGPSTPPPAPDWSTAPGQQQSPPKGKSKLFKVGLVLLVLGAIVAAVAIPLGISRIPDIDAFPQATGDETVELTAGEWTVWGVNGTQTPTVVGPGGEEIAIEPPFGSQNFSTDSRSGEAIGSVDITTAGSYEVSSPPGQTTLFAQGLVSGIFVAVGLIAAGVFGGGLLFVIGIVLAAIGFGRR